MIFRLIGDILADIFCGRRWLREENARLSSRILDAEDARDSWEQLAIQASWSAQEATKAVRVSEKMSNDSRIFYVPAKEPLSAMFYEPGRGPRIDDFPRAERGTMIDVACTMRFALTPVLEQWSFRLADRLPGVFGNNIEARSREIRRAMLIVMLVQNVSSALDIAEKAAKEPA